ncbi:MULTISPECIES: 4-hydroxyphenylacetate 3-monooxygenase, oxygenase component [Streptomyces]|uniref:4-hydroxyphenylacetate 3-monooxygenase, oxygenase component n=1 Tax=Streptomyces TaxID=1883 RepID=UPI003426B080
MGARTAQEYLAGLNDGREVWLGGESVKDVTSHPALRRGASSIGAWLDRQHEAELRDVLTFPSPESGDRVATSFLRPVTQEDLGKRSAAFLEAARWSGGMLGRTPDYLNSSFMALASASEFFTAVNPEFGRNIEAYFRHLRENDIVLTHTLVNPSVNRRLTDQGIPSAQVALHIVRHTDRGIVVRGARLLATLGPLADELVVFPSTSLKDDPSSTRYAFAFAVPCATSGLRFLCRDSYDTGRPVFDAPLSARFEEMDAVVVFDDVEVPWERIFLLEDPSSCNAVHSATNSLIHMMHQVVCKNIAKAEFMVGLLCAMTGANQRDRAPQTQAQIAEAMCVVEMMKACLTASEAHARADQWGTMTPDRMPLDAARNVFPQQYQRLVELVQLLGSSSLMATPAQADLTSAIAGDIDTYFALENLESPQRIGLFRLAQDAAVSGFGARQALYERFFFGAPERVAGMLFQAYDKEPLTKRIFDFLGRPDGLAGLTDGSGQRDTASEADDGR